MAKSSKQVILDAIDRDIADLQRTRAYVANSGEDAADAPAKKQRKPRTKRGLPTPDEP